MRPELLAVVLKAVLCLFERHVRELAEKVRVLDQVHHLQMLLKPAGDGTGLGCHLRVKEIVAPLKRSFEQTAPVVAGTSGHVVGGYVRRRASGRPEPDSKTTRQVKQYLRHEIASVTQSALAFILSLLHQLIVRLLQQIFKENQVL